MVRQPILVLILAAVISETGFTQTPPPPPPPPAPAKPIRTVGKAEIYYFGDSNRSSSKVFFYLIGDYTTLLKEDTLSMEASISSEGKSISKPARINLLIDSYSHGKTYKYKDKHKVAIVTDGSPLGSGETRSVFQEIDPRGSVREMFSGAIPYEVFLKILDAKKVIVSFGDIETELSPNQLEALRDLNRTIQK